MDRGILIAYFTWSGNTRRIAYFIHEVVGGTLFVIEPETPYPHSYNLTLQQAKREIQAGYKPPLRSKVDSCQPYEVIFVGSPNWWSTIAPPVATFLSEHDLSGRTIVPFSTHGGGGQGRVISDIKKLCPQSTVLEGLAVPGSEAKNAQSKVLAWLQKIGLIE